MITGRKLRSSDAFIRNVTEQKSTAQRFQNAFRDVDSKTWQLFVRPWGIEWAPEPLKKNKP